MRIAEDLSRSWMKKIAREQAVESLCHAALQLGLPIALWRQPGQTAQQLLIDLSGKAERLRPEVEMLSPGFLFSPYEADLTAAEEEKGEALFLRAHIFFTTNEDSRLHIASDLSAGELLQAETLISVAEEYAVSGAAGKEEKLPYYTHPAVTASGTDKESYCRLVEEAIQQIREGQLQKVVCARSKSLPAPEGFQPLSLFQSLARTYKNAFVSFVSIPGTGSWMGASPETLIRINRQKTFHTMALAGTQPKSAASSPAEAVWRQKEIEEQALVSRYIINCFKKIRLREFSEDGPRTVVAGNLMHLRTDFSVDMQEADFPALGSVMLSLLHPTSAVCGMPRAAAKSFLQEKEALDRQFFAGFLGPVKLQEKTSLFVNLRCMQLLENELMLYAGAGITANSNPEKEWQETEDKCSTLAALL
jgi:isochorismate synthase